MIEALINNVNNAENKVLNPLHKLFITHNKM